MANLTVNTKKDGQITLNTKPHSDPLIALDETAVLWDMLSNTTVDSIGHNTVAMKTTGQETTKVSVCLTAKADWTKWKPFIVFPGAKRETKLLNEEFKAKCVVASSSNGRMNEELTNLGVGFVQVPRDGNNQEPRTSKTYL